MFTIIKNYVVNYSNLDKISKYFINSIFIFARIRGLKIRLRKKKIRYFILFIKYTCMISKQKETLEICYLNPPPKKKPHYVVCYKYFTNNNVIWGQNTVYVKTIS